jgi:hypothetical protein
MKLIASFALSLLALSAHAAGTVQVTFLQPERFSDVRDSFYSSERHLDLLKQHLQAAAAPYVADGQTLKIEVLDVDLAGELRPSARANNRRVLRGGADWPRIQLRYALEAPGQTLRSGEARVQDLAYLQRDLGGYRSREALYHERRMLDEWFEAEFRK